MTLATQFPESHHSGMTLGIRYLRSAGQLFLQGMEPDEWGEGGIGTYDGGGFFAPLEVVADVRLTALRSALRSAVAADAWNLALSSYVSIGAAASFVFADAHPDQVDHKHTPTHDIWLDLAADRTLLVAVAVTVRKESWTVEGFRHLLEPMLAQFGAAFVHADQYGEAPFAGIPWLWTVWVKPRIRGETMATAFRLGLSVSQLVEAAEGGRIGPEKALELLKAGFGETLIGQPESQWLEAKACAWDLADLAGRIELAQDVSRFANGDSGAVLVVGFGTKKISGVDTLVLGPGTSFSRRDVDRIHKVLDQRIHPPIDGLQVQAVSDGRGGNLLCIYVPNQPEELKPFLVHGAIVGPKVEGAFISIVRRRGEHSIAIGPASVHAALAAGRALLRGSNATPGEFNAS